MFKKIISSAGVLNKKAERLTLERASCCVKDKKPAAYAGTWV